MPARSQSTGQATSTRQSPRKRKIIDISDPNSASIGSPPASKNKVTKSDLETAENPQGGLTDRTKRDIVLDEPMRTDVARSVKHDGSRKSNGDTGLDTKSARDLSSDLSSAPESEQDSKQKPAKPPKKRKTREEKGAADMSLAPRTPGLTHFVGAHVSIAKGVENAITNAVHIGGNALACFLQSQRKWENPELKSENRDAFISACSHHNYDAKQHIVPHGSYLVNLAAKDPDQAKKSYNFFLNDLKRCEALGIRLYNFHPGATNKEPLPEAISRLAKNLNRALSETSTVVALLENMAGTETIIGSRFSDLAQIIAEVKPEYQSRVGICIDTCHTFAAGYDLRSPETFQKTLQELDDTVGLKYLKAMHLNDSKGMFGSKKDLHQNIGTGFLGLRPFHSIMNEPRLANIPLILETPCERPDPKDAKKSIEDKTVWSKEIKLLESLIGMDPESKEYKQLEEDLAAIGKAERDKMRQWQADKEAKEETKANKARKKLETVEKGQKGIAGMFASNGSKRGKKQKSLSPASSDGG